jgi:hypothetical protein
VVVRKEAEPPELEAAPAALAALAVLPVQVQVLLAALVELRAAPQAVERPERRVNRSYTA